MRVFLIVMIILSLLFVLFLAVRSPQPQRGVSRVGAPGSALKRWLEDTEPGDQGASDFRLANPGSGLKDAPEPLYEAKECGPPPVNPWTQGPSVSPREAQRYELALRIWEYCKAGSHPGQDRLPTFSPPESNAFNNLPDEPPPEIEEP